MNIFLQAEWRKLLMANYKFDSKILKKYLPRKTELDLWNNECLVSLVGFMFIETKVKGFKIPFHVNFEEVNLRFYVKYLDNKIWKRGVVFLKEIVPRTCITLVANTLYKEHYETMSMFHNWDINEKEVNVEYGMKKHNINSFKILAENKLNSISEGSEAEFITEHYWGYTLIDDLTTAEYEVQHPRWDIYNTINYDINVDFANIYGDEFGDLDTMKPQSVFLAEGSPIIVKKGKFI